MIRIRKRIVVPAPLATLGAADRLRLEAIYQAAPAACQTARSKLLEANPAIYGDAEVKAALVADQHEKCCYCESKFIATGFGDVEYFRPKGGVRQQTQGKLEKPGYYWLAYEWNNLFFSCEICNRRYKRNWFPLLNPTLRAREHKQSISRERALLPDLGQTNSGRYLTLQQACYNRHRSPRQSVHSSLWAGPYSPQPAAGRVSGNTEDYAICGRP